MIASEIASLRPHRYAKAALENQYNVIACAGAVLFSLAFASFVPLIAGLVAEAAWLFTAPRLPAFRRWVQARAAETQRASTEHDVRATLAGLDSAYALRFSAIEATVGEILELYAKKPGLSRGEIDAVRERLIDLSRSFVEFCRIHQRLSRFVVETPEAELEREIQGLGRSLQGEKDLGVRFTVRQALTLAQRRLQQLEQIANTRRAVEVRTDTIEKSFAYIKSRVLGFGGGQDLYSEIDAITLQVGSAADIEAAMQAAMSGVASQTGS